MADMYNELNTVFSLTSLVMVALNGGAGRPGKLGRPDPTNHSAQISDEAVKYFNPHSNSIAAGLCSYRIIRRKVLDRIPGSLTANSRLTHTRSDNPQSQ